MGAPGLLRLVVLAALLALPALAWASRLDSGWAGGVYDDADADDVVLTVDSTVAMPVPVVTVAVPAPTAAPLVVPAPGSHARPQAVPAGPPRAPPPA
jgi:hypothetical protein